MLTKFIEAAETGITAKFETSYEIGDIKYWFCFTAVKQHEILVVTTDDITESKRSERALS
ncbi:hypothetical protein [Flavobacterium flavigenum]|uniref:hypothetical protein n=1 Tax=Flavobacterium flavigenum TaxID=3003258 RepID=UPI0022ABDF42|nr:hypothetical protein [Flavobacterium flavigenum]